MDIHEAASGGHLEEVRRLIRHDPQLVDDLSWRVTPILEAVTAGKLEVAAFLIDRASSSSNYVSTYLSI